MNSSHRFNGKRFAVASAKAGAPSSFCGIAFMAKASAPGRAKTRLVPPLTYEEAAALNTAFLRDVADNLLLASRHSASRWPITGYAAFSPAGSEAFFGRVLPSGIELIGASEPNFGDCLFHTVEQIFARGHSAAVVLNSDSPTLPTALLVETAEMLARPGDRAVLGPSADGGYYLLGLKAAHRRLFEDVAWSTERVAQQTLERAREVGLDVHRLPVWYDVDDQASLRRLHTELCEPGAMRRSDAPNPHYAIQTAKLMYQLEPKLGFAPLAGLSLETEPARV